MGDVWIVLPIVAGIVFVLLLVVIIIAISQAHKARMSAVNKRSFEELALEKLANELKHENAKIMTELATMNKSIETLLAEKYRNV